MNGACHVFLPAAAHSIVRTPKPVASPTKPSAMALGWRRFNIKSKPSAAQMRNTMDLAGHDSLEYGWLCTYVDGLATPELHVFAMAAVMCRERRGSATPRRASRRVLQSASSGSGPSSWYVMYCAPLLPSPPPLPFRASGVVRVHGTSCVVHPISAPWVGFLQLGHVRPA